MITIIQKWILCISFFLPLTELVSGEKKQTLSSHVPGTSIYQAIEMFNGVWRLQRRVSADGTQHGGVLEGIMMISLEPHRGKLLGVQGVGTVYAEESGLMDRRFGYCCPVEAAGKNFYTESSGTWLVSLESENDKEAVLAVRSTTSVKGTYGPYEEGLWSNVEARYRLVRVDMGRPGLPRGSTLELIRPRDPVSDAGGGLSSGPACCSVGTLSGKGNEVKIEWGEGGEESLEMWMEIKWANGARDIWRRDPRGCAGYRTCDGTLSFPRLGTRDSGPPERAR